MHNGKKFILCVVHVGIMIDCVFCKIIEGKLRSYRTYENENVIAFAPLKKDVIAKGHMLVAPKKHYENIYDIPIEELAPIMETIKDIAETLKEKFGADGINILHASGKVAQQSVFHFHIHLIPRHGGDGLNAWPEIGHDKGNYLKIYEEIGALFR